MLELFGQNETTRLKENCVLLLAQSFSFFYTQVFTGYLDEK